MTARLRPWTPHLVAILSAVVILAPALAPGVMLAYDLAWSPDPRLTPAVLGLDTPAPRVVPSDVVAVLLSSVLTAGVAQKVVLVGALVSGSLGALRLLHIVLGRPAGQVSAIGVVLAAQWNPFVAERLAIGQWTVLWGYALVPWIWSTALRVRAGGGPLPVLGVLALSALGGANSMLIVTLALLPVLLWSPVPVRTTGLALLTVAGGSTAWALPAVLSGVSGDEAGIAAFGARADTPLGLVGSLLSGGGIWNVAAWPSERATWLLAGAALLVSLGAVMSVLKHRAEPWCGPMLAAAVPWLLAGILSAWQPVRPVWEAVLSLPGGGLLRDSHKLLAPWAVLVAVGLALAAERWRTSERPARPALAWGAAVIPVPLLLSMGWGLSGDLRAVSVPQDVLAAARVVSEAPPGRVGLLPWNQYRRYAWNGDRISLSVLPRMIDQPVLQDDSLPLRDGRVAGERREAADISADIADGADPAASLIRHGVRYLVVERQAIPAAPPLPKDARVIHDGPYVVVLAVDSTASVPETGWTFARVVGWALFGITHLAVLGAAIITRARRRSGEGM